MANQLDSSEIIAILEYGDHTKVSDLKQMIAEYLVTNKDTWLVYALVDAYITSYSLKCADILHTVREPHDKQLLERLNEHIKGENKLPGLSLLGHLILKQPPWLHLVLNHSIFTTILKCLKVETDVPILVTALLCLTSLLPVDPVKSAVTFNELFIVLERLVVFMYQKPANVSAVYGQHLEQTVSAYFYRLYGMFPCNFLVSLRTLCSQPDFVEVFTNVVMPLVEKLRMHPLLLTGSKEKEVAKDRWKQKDIQDIVAECATYSLDPVECGADPLESWPSANALSAHQIASAGSSMRDSLIMSNAALQFATEKRDSTNNQASVEPASEAMVRSLLASGRLFGVQARAGLSTPPLLPPTAGSDTSGTSSSQQGTQSNTPARTTPFGGSSESSSVANLASVGAYEDPDKRTTGGLAEKRQSNLSLSLSSKATVVSSPPETSRTGDSSVPPSPFLKDFGFDTTPAASSAIRKISFEPHVGGAPVAVVVPMSLGIQPVLANVHPATVTASASISADQKKTSLAAVSSPPIAVPTSELTSAGRSQGHHSKSAGAAVPSPSVAELPTYIDGLEVAQEDVADDEVSELTGSTCGVDESTPRMDTDNDQAVAPVTSESVAAFMKKMNRIRFISMNFSTAAPPNAPQPKKAWENTLTSDPVKLQRSRSCPDVSSLGESSDSDLSRTQLVVAGKNKQPSVKESFVPESEVSDNQKGGVALSPADDKTVKGAKVEDEREEQLAVARGLVLPYEHLLPASQRSCAMCGGVMSDSNPSVPAANTQGHTLPASVPLRYSADTSALISQYVDVGSKLYTDTAARKMIAKGNLPSVADDVETLKGQVHMLQTQVLFERHRREMHVKKNRGQLRHVLNAAKFEIENTTLKKLLTMKEDENKNIMTNLHWLEQQAIDAKKLRDSQESSMETTIKNLKKEVESLTAKNIELQATVDGHAQERDKSHKQIQALNSDLFTLQHEVEALRERADASKRLHEDVVHLNKELLLMGELQQKYQQRLAAVSVSHNIKPELQFLLDACKQELATTKQQLEHKCLLYDALKTRVTELEDLMKKKDEMLIEYKRLLEGERQEHCAKLTSLEEYCSGQRKVQVALNAHILQLYSEIGQLKLVTSPTSRGGGGGSSSSSSSAGAAGACDDDNLSGAHCASKHDVIHS